MFTLYVSFDPFEAVESFEPDKSFKSFQDDGTARALPLLRTRSDKTIRRKHSTDIRIVPNDSDELNDSSGSTDSESFRI